MPYISQEYRERYDALVDQLVKVMMQESLTYGVRDANTTKGHHNYIMYTLAIKLADELGIRYHTLQDIIGTFECCKLELYRKIIAPYEEKAIEKNGDVK